MRRVSLVVLALAGCGGSPVEHPVPLVLEPVSPPQFTSHDVFLAARGDVIVLGKRISRDGGQTWQPHDPRLGAEAGLERVAIHGSVIALHVPALGLARWDLATGEVTSVTDTPAFAAPRTWRTTPEGRFVAFDPVRNAIAFERAGGWTLASVPQPAATEVDPYVADVESNGTIALAASGWGVFRSDDAGASWSLVTRPLPGAGRDLVVLADRGFVLLGGSTTYRFDAAGNPAGEAPGIAVQLGQTVVCDDGALLALDRISRDAGETWQPLLGGGDLILNVNRVGCGGGSYWVVGYSDTWGYRLLRVDVAGVGGLAVGNWEDHAPRWTANGPPVVRTSDGTVIAAGLAFHDGDPGWSLREVPGRTWAAGDTLFGLWDGRFWISDDAGRTWRAAMTTGLGDGDAEDEQLDIEAFARDPDGAFHVSHFTVERTASEDHFRTRVWRSPDGSAWTIAYEATAIRDHASGEVTGEVHRFVGITADGTWIATDAISRDAGQTWQPTNFEGDRSLAFLTPGGHLVTPRDDLWRVYEAGELRATWALEADGQPVPASQLRSVAFDEDGHAYVARGAPYVRLWRTTEPLVAPTNVP
jgi:hypothetical protein